MPIRFLSASVFLLAGETVPGLVARTACAPASVSRKVSVARQFFAEAESRSLIPVNPATRLRGFQVSGESKTLGLSRQQARELLERIETVTLLGLRDTPVPESASSLNSCFSFVGRTAH